MRLFRLVPLLLLLLLATAVPRAALAGYNAGDACDKAGKIYTAEKSGAPALVCNGTTLQVFESVAISPTRKGVALSAPETTLDVNGEIRPGYTGIACSATIEGAIRYSSADNHVEFCNGTDWASFPVADTSDQTPDAFSFTALTDQSLNTLVQSNTPTITGFTGAVVASVSGGGNPEISINGGAWVTSGAISSGQTIRVRLTTSGSVSTLRTATVTIGTGSANWDVTTRAGQLLIFRTSATYNGALGGLAGADGLCQAQANTLGYPGTYKAILSDSTTNAKDRLTLSYPIVRASDGTTVVASTNLWVGSLDNPVEATAGLVWSGTSTAGLKLTNLQCTDWTVAASPPYGRRGEGDKSSGSWIDVGDPNTNGCAGGLRLYCIQQ